MQASRTFLATTLGVVIGLSAVLGGSQTARVNPDAALLAEFTSRVKAYTDLRGKLDNTTPPLTEHNDPAKIQAAMDALAVKLRSARAEARPGDIFFLEVRKKFRALLTPTLKGKAGAQAKESILDEVPKVPLVVNAAYPKEQPLSTMPASMLEALPALPDGLEYRFVGKHLILRDTRANIIVDFIYNAVP
jgi:hypothetical protein